MDLIADLLLGAGAFGAAFYCFVLSRRLSKFNDLEEGVGGAVAVLSAQVDDLTKALERARDSAGTESQKLDDLTARAEDAAKRLELMMASMHDLPEAPTSRRPSPKPEYGRTSAPDRTAETYREDLAAEDDHYERPAPSEPVFTRTSRRAS